MSQLIKIKKGLDIPLLGEPEKIINSVPRSARYSISPVDFHGLTPKMLVKEGEKVKAGTPLFFDKYNEKIIFSSPVSGIFSDLVRGEKRRILKLTIDADPVDEYLDLGSADPLSLHRDLVKEKILQSGLWAAIIQRPFSIIARPDVMPKAIFVSAFDSSPLAPDLDFVINGQEKEFQTGINALSKLTNGKVHLGIHATKSISRAFVEAKNVEIHRFSGPHPAGNVGIQIHHIDPINKGEVAWQVDVQNVIMIGRLFEKGIVDYSKIIALSGSEVINPRYYRVSVGARISDIVQKNLRVEEGTSVRIISGNVLTGKKVAENEFLGFYDNQVTAIPEGDKPEILGWIAPNFDKFSVSRTFPAFLMPWKKYRADTNIRGGERPFVVTGLYEKVLPMDILPMQLLKSIMINDIDMMEKLGIYEVAPEDFALCEYVCPSKIDIQETIRDGLDVVMKEFE